MISTRKNSNNNFYKSVNVPKIILSSNNYESSSCKTYSEVMQYIMSNQVHYNYGYYISYVIILHAQLLVYTSSSEIRDWSLQGSEQLLQFLHLYNVHDCDIELKS